MISKQEYLQNDYTLEVSKKLVNSAKTLLNIQSS